MCLRAVFLSALMVTTSGFLSERIDVIASIKPPTHTHFGEWKKPTYCNYGTFAYGITLENEPFRFFGDDTAVNKVQLHCT